MQPRDPSTPDIGLLESEISLLTGILAARVVTTASGRISEVHVLADRTKPAKQIVRDIQTLALARLGLEIDYRVVSVVQFGKNSLGAGASRAVLLAVSTRTDRTRIICEVSMAVGDRQTTAVAEEAATHAGRHRAAARAALEAAQVVCGVDPRFHASEVMLIESAGRRAVVVLVEAIADSGDETLVGSALIRRDESEAVARAVLDALNRRLVRQVSAST